VPASPCPVPMTGPFGLPSLEEEAQAVVVTLHHEEDDRSFRPAVHREAAHEPHRVTQLGEGPTRSRVLPRELGNFAEQIWGVSMSVVVATNSFSVIVPIRCRGRLCGPVGVIVSGIQWRRV
jgi:hypothetical protein